MATAPRIYPESYSGPIRTSNRTRNIHYHIIENIPEVMNAVALFIDTEYNNMGEVTHYVNKINDLLKVRGSKIVIKQLEYIYMLNRFNQGGNDYVKACKERAAILSEFSI